MLTAFLVGAGEKRKRLDKFLAHREPAISRSSLQRLIRHGRVRVNDHAVKPNKIIKPGDTITIDEPQPGALAINGKPLQLDILFEDAAILVLDKPAGIVVHPGPGHWHGTLLNGLLEHLKNTSLSSSSIAEYAKPGLVHRLDKHTSGIMVIAKTQQAHRELAKQFEHRSITRAYEAIVWGVSANHAGVIDVPIGRDKRNPQIYSTQTAKPLKATTAYTVNTRYGAVASRVHLHTRTGRTHQLRVHLTALGLPILGDQAYGGRKVMHIAGIHIPRVMLHACHLGFRHPIFRNFQEYNVRLPADMRYVIQRLQSLGE